MNPIYGSSDECTFEVVKTFGECREGAPEFIFLAVNHWTQNETVSAFVKSLDKSRTYQMISETSSEEDGWDDPLFVKKCLWYKEHIGILARYSLIRDASLKDAYDRSKHLLKPLYQTHVIGKRDAPEFPNLKQDYLSHMTSLEFLKSIILGKVDEDFDEDYFQRQQYLCLSITNQSSLNLPAIWVGGAGHFVRRMAKKGDKVKKGLDLFEKAVKDTNKSAIIVLASKKIP